MDWKLELDKVEVEGKEEEALRKASPCFDFAAKINYKIKINNRGYFQIILN